VTTATEWLSVKDFLGRHKGRIGRNSVYDRVKDGTLPSVKLGRRILIPGDALERLLAEGSQLGTKEEGED
jgi:excisionase family DNA binding protein